MVDQRQLSGVLSEFARTMLSDFAVQGILDGLVARVVDVMPVTSAGVTLISPGAAPAYVAASDAAALRFEQLQTELAEGPCVAAFESGLAVVVPDVREEGRFREFRSRAARDGLAAVFTFPLRGDPQPLGALDLYRDVPGPLDADALAAAQTLADVASAYVRNAQARVDLAAAYDEVRETALHDPLTGLANRALLAERLGLAAARARRLGTTTGVLFVDLDRFKWVNDVHGHRAGDALLVRVAHRLAALLRPSDTLARLSGDEFVAVCEDLDGPARVEALAARIGAALAEPFVLAHGAVEMTASIGIAFAGRGDDLPDRLIEDADIAMYQAKRKGGGRYEVIDLRQQRVAGRRRDLAGDLRRAAVRGELRVDYQPVVSVADGRITGVEALLRWDHPSLGLIPAAVTVAVAEGAGLIGEVGRWVLRRACQDRRWWRTDDVGLSVNVSASQLAGHGFAAAVESALRDTSIPPGVVTLEVPDSVLVDDRARALVVVDDLRGIGVGVALDAVGTGPASLGSLSRSSIDALKIDRSFVAGLPGDRACRAVVSAVVELARGLGVPAVAAGVETAEQRGEVAALGCDQAQGYYFARPMPQEDLVALLAPGAASGRRLPAAIAGGAGPGSPGPAVPA